MTDGMRFIVQINVEGKGWTAYVKPKTRRTGKYTLTIQEAAAYLTTLPTENNYRIVQSTCSSGLINQKVVGYQLTDLTKD